MDRDLILAILSAVKAVVEAVFETRPNQKLDAQEVLAAIDAKMASVDNLQAEMEAILNGEAD